jgi:hypothetical protein
VLTVRPAAAPHRPASWGRRKLLALLAATATVSALLLVGMALAVVDTLHADRPDSRRTAGGSGIPTAPTGDGSAATLASPASTGLVIDPVTQQAARDALANAAMPRADDSAAQPGPVSTRDPGPTLPLPRAVRVGPVDVAAGFPPTRLGALAQLAAIDQAALQAGTLAEARAVITAWALPGGPTADSWSGVAALAGFLTAAGLSGGGSPQLGLVVTPLMGLIKGTVGPHFVIPCVDFEVDATLTRTARVAVADCQRMVWTGQRWMVGPGSEPADPPSVWPDTDAAFDVGYRDLRHA